MTFLAAVILIVTYSIAMRRYIMLLPVLTSLAVLICAPHVFNLDVAAFAWVMLSVTSFTFLFGLAWLIVSHLPARARGEDAQEPSV